MELHQLRDRDQEQTKIIQHMNQEILLLHQEVTSLTTTDTNTPRTSPDMEEQIATIQIAIEETSRWVDVVKKSPKVTISATIVEQ